jgi:hypothetical protein
VDLKVVTLADLDGLIERPAILFSRDADGLAARLDGATPVWPDPDAEWFEARIWIWLHYGAAKLGRGEIFEALGILAFLREQVLGPMLHRPEELPQRGVRRLEALGLDPRGLLAATVADPSPTSKAALLALPVSTWTCAKMSHGPFSRPACRKPWWPTST